ncbi:secreted RxLR effector protein 161-like [Brassica napus]|uniref:secreted RxLR effector protein 161-like n=1 Tax=Brassica napus TaxID=3708 RepID=UPI0020786E9E|nr:secreted RxLR effector protein 161-like [Brassica napus]
MYATVGTLPDIAHVVGVVSRFMGNPGREHSEAVKWILRYVKETTDYGLWFTKNTEFKVEGYCDADFASDRDRSRSVTGYLFQVGGNTVSWRSGLQLIVALSTTESECMSLTEGAKEALWLKGVCEDLSYDQGAVKINCESQSAIFLAKNGGYHERTKHIHRKFNFITDVIEDGSVSVVKVNTSLNLADILTKSVPGKTLEKALVSVKVCR